MSILLLDNGIAVVSQGFTVTKSDLGFALAIHLTPTTDNVLTDTETNLPPASTQELENE